MHPFMKTLGVALNVLWKIAVVALLAVIAVDLHALANARFDEEPAAQTAAKPQT